MLKGHYLSTFWVSRVSCLIRAKGSFYGGHCFQDWFFCFFFRILSSLQRCFLWLLLVFTAVAFVALGFHTRHHQQTPWHHRDRCCNATRNCSIHAGGFHSRCSKLFSARTRIAPLVSRWGGLIRHKQEALGRLKPCFTQADCSYKGPYPSVKL